MNKNEITDMSFEEFEKTLAGMRAYNAKHPRPYEAVSIPVPISEPPTVTTPRTNAPAVDEVFGPKSNGDKAQRLKAERPEIYDALRKVAVERGLVPSPRYPDLAKRAEAHLEYYRNRS